MNKEIRRIVSSVARFMLLPVGLGLLAGAAGGMVAFSYYLAGLTETPMTAPNRPSFAVTAPLPETLLAERLQAMNVPVYLKRAAVGTPTERALTADQAIGTAAVVTTDGWLMTYGSVVKDKAIAVAIGGRLFEPKQVVHDPATGAAFIKVEAGPLAIAGLEETGQLKPGTALYLEDGDGHFAKAWFSGTALKARAGRPKALLDSDQFSRAWRLDRAVDPKAIGGAVMTVGGNLAGILLPSAEGPATFLPIHLFRSRLGDLFRGAPPARPVLGLNYLDLSTVTLSGQPPASSGLLVAGSRRDGVPAVVSGGPAALSGIREGDILLRLDDTDLQDGRDLAELLADYRPGAKASLELLRGGERLTLEVTLR